MSSHHNETDARPYRTETDANPFAASSMTSPLAQVKHRKPPGGIQMKARKMESSKPSAGPIQNERRFMERQNLYQDEIFEFKRNGTDPGTVMIFNQEIFDNDKIRIRRGSRRDVNEIIICFQRLGFNISESNVHTDLTVEEILHELDLVVQNKEALQATNCLIVFFLSHGHSNEELHGKDAVMRSSEIWRKFVDCKELERKPKMFIFQACKGDFYTTTTGVSNFYNDNDDPSKIIELNNFSANPLGPDMLIAYATLEGNLSFRNPLTGTWFIQELCKNFSSYGRRDDVISMITRTIKCVCGNYYNLNEEKSPEIQKQMPVFVSTLSRKFYLNRNKDRNVLLNIQKETQEIHKLVDDIAKYIKSDLGSLKTKR